MSSWSDVDIDQDTVMVVALSAQENPCSCYDEDCAKVENPAKCWLGISSCGFHIEQADGYCPLIHGEYDGTH